MGHGDQQGVETRAVLQYPVAPTIWLYITHHLDTLHPPLIYAATTI
jgi:hypothetical protein